MGKREQKKLAIERAEKFCKDKLVQKFNDYSSYYNVKDLIWVDTQYTGLLNSTTIYRYKTIWEGKLLRWYTGEGRVHKYRKSNWVSGSTMELYRDYIKNNVLLLRNKLRRKMKDLGLEVEDMFSRDEYYLHELSPSIWDLQELIFKLEGPWTRYNDLEI